MEKEILTLEEELRQAMLANNVKILDELISDSLIFVAPDGNLVTKTMDLETHRNKLQIMKKLEPSEQKVVLYSGFAVVTVQMSIEGQFLGQDISGKYRYLRIWAKEEEKLRVVSGSVTRI